MRSYLNIDSFLSEVARDLGFRFTENAVFGEFQGVPVKILSTGSGLFVIFPAGASEVQDVLRERIIAFGSINGLKLKKSDVSFNEGLAKIRIFALLRSTGAKKVTAALKTVHAIHATYRDQHIVARCSWCQKVSSSVALLNGNPVHCCEKCSASEGKGEIDFGRDYHQFLAERTNKTNEMSLQRAKNFLCKPAV